MTRGSRLAAILGAAGTLGILVMIFMAWRHGGLPVLQIGMNLC